MSTFKLLRFNDILNIALTCKGLKHVVYDEPFCKAIVQVSFLSEVVINHNLILTCTKSQIPYCTEAREATAREAAGEATSSVWARALRCRWKRQEALAKADPFTVAILGYSNIYIYTNGVLCYIVDKTVRVLDVHSSAQVEIVISIPLLLMQEIPTVIENPSISLLYYADGILSCIILSESLNILVAVNISNPSDSVLISHQLDSKRRIFVRNNETYLYYGTLSEVDVDGHRKWAVHGFNLQTKEEYPKIVLDNLLGVDIGAQVCFQLHNNYFYALSNLSAFEIEEPDFKSFYQCVRFPLDSPQSEAIETTIPAHMWRRQHDEEGPLDDRWLSLSLATDESTGRLMIIESRMELCKNKHPWRRISYITNIIFPKELDASSSLVAYTKETDGLSSVNNSVIKLQNPNEPLQRKPKHVHLFPGDSGKRRTLPICSYHASTSTYLDMMNTAMPTGKDEAQYLQLRCSSRFLGPQEIYQEQPISYWPPPQDPSKTNQQLDSLYAILNTQGEVDGVVDERSVLYSTKGSDGRPKLILIAFDPSMRLEGIKPLVNGIEIENVDERLYPERNEDIDYKQDTNGGKWIWKERAMYQEIKSGFSFYSDKHRYSKT